MTTGIVLHIPHSSRVIPKELRAQFLLDDEQLDAELLSMTDSYTDELFAQSVPGACAQIFPVSRLVVDPERFVDDDVETMSRVGMGVVYTKTSTGTPLRTVSAASRADLIRRFYDPHHASFTEAVENALAAHGGCLLIDCHSFPSSPLPYELDQSLDRPDICIGTDSFHTPAELLDALRSRFESASLRVFVDRPFAGSFVPAAHFHRERRVKSVMIEVNRRLYMDERTGDRLPTFGSITELLRGVLSAVAVPSAGNEI